MAINFPLWSSRPRETPCHSPNVHYEIFRPKGESLRFVRARCEAVLLWVDGTSDFNGLHSRQHDDEVQFYAFDILVLNGNDLRKLPLSLRKQNLARLLQRRPDGIFGAPFERGETGFDVFRKMR